MNKSGHSSTHNRHGKSNDGKNNHRIVRCYTGTCHRNAVSVDDDHGNIRDNVRENIVTSSSNGAHPKRVGSKHEKNMACDCNHWQLMGVLDGPAQPGSHDPCSCRRWRACVVARVIRRTGVPVIVPAVSPPWSNLWAFSSGAKASKQNMIPTSSTTATSTATTTTMSTTSSTSTSSSTGTTSTPSSTSPTGTTSTMSTTSTRS